MTGAQSSNNTISKQGLDYHSNRPYQTGDPLKNIDWKHSYMLGKLTVKQYSGSQGGVGVIVADLTASDAKEADALAYDLVMSALTLANEGLPSALAVYNQKEVIAATTQAMDSRETLKKAIELTGKILIEESKGKVLQPAELQRVKRSIDQLGRSGLVSAQLPRHKTNLHKETPVLCGNCKHYNPQLSDYTHCIHTAYSQLMAPSKSIRRTKVSH